MGILNGVTKTILRPGNGRDSAKKGDTVIIEYRGCLYDESSGADNYFMGTQYVRLDEKKERLIAPECLTWRVSLFTQ